MRVAIYGSRHQEEYVNEIVALMAEAAGSGHTLVLHEKIARYLSEQVPERFADVAAVADVVGDDGFTADVALSVGGDGTFLRTTQWVGSKEIPIIGVNTGHLGFLAPFTVSEAAAELKAFAAGRSTIEARSLIRLDAPSAHIDVWPYALNEVAILKKDTASMISVLASADRVTLADYLCDGLIIATPTGSTGYNLSVGGPIVTPGSPSLVIAPIAAHSLTMRPLVVCDSTVLEFKVTSRSPQFRISLDGRSFHMPCGTVFYLSRAPFVVKSVRKPGLSFFATIREKLLWGTTPRQS